ncbi:hypothetical protein Lser_V15G13865 [Lactuca serriola]
MGPTYLSSYFLFPIVNNSKLLKASSRPLLDDGTARVKDDDLDSNPGCEWSRWAVDIRPLPEPNRFNRLSPLGSPDELGLLPDTTARFDVLPVRDIRPLSESPC